jgi:hypothetical protein
VLDVSETPWRAVEVRDIGDREYLRQAEIIRSLAETYNGARVLVDATTHDQMVEELKRQKVKADPYKFTNASKTELIDALVLALEHGKLKIPRRDDLIRELTYYRFETTPAGTVKLGAPHGAGHFDDLVTALALAVFAATSRRQVPLVAPPSTRKPREGDGASLSRVMGYDWDHRPGRDDLRERWG